MVTPKEIIKRYISFFEKRGHTRIPNASLIPENDPTTLFTSSGMQPLVPYLLGEPHPAGKRLVNVQNCFRAQDIDEVGDNRHTTFFRMLGNWSLGDYFKKEQLPWFFEFLTDQDEGLGLDPQRLYVTVFGGDAKFKVFENGKYQPLRPDVEAVDIWTRIFEKHEIDAKVANLSSREQSGIAEGRIFYYGAKKNWWSRAGTPEQMPIGEPGGPDSEVFYDLGEELKIHENSKFKSQKCHPNCECGRFLEIGNSVFMQYKKIDELTFEELPNKNVDFGGGLERLVVATNNSPDVFSTDSYLPIIRGIQTLNTRRYNVHPDINRYFRIIADHLKASIMLIDSGAIPSNKEQGYVVRRLLRRAIWYGRNYLLIPDPFTTTLLDFVLETCRDVYPEIISKEAWIAEILTQEEMKFLAMIDKGTSQLPKIAKKYAREKLIESNAQKVIMTQLDTRATGELLFYMYETYGFPPDLVRDILEEQGWSFSANFVEEFQEAKEKHQEISRAGAAKKFAGGLADHAKKTIMGHTATHLLHQALRDVLGGGVFQTGSNITAERVRFDFSFDRALTQEELQRIEMVVNGKIKENLRVYAKIIDMKEAKRIGAIGLFEDTYGEKVKVYYIGGRGEEAETAYSKEFCGGPHVKYTGEVKQFTIIKEEGLGKGVRRIYARVGE